MEKEGGNSVATIEWIPINSRVSTELPLRSQIIGSSRIRFFINYLVEKVAGKLHITRIALSLITAVMETVTTITPSPIRISIMIKFTLQFDNVN